MEKMAVIGITKCTVAIRIVVMRGAASNRSPTRSSNWLREAARAGAGRQQKAFRGQTPPKFMVDTDSDLDGRDKVRSDKVGANPDIASTTN